MVSPILILPDALEQVKKRLDERGGGSLRLGVHGGGCSGFSYVLQFDDEPPRQNDVSWCVGGATFVVDKKSLLYLTGSRLAWRNTLMRTGFEFENSKESSRCGCGHSFGV